MKRKRTRKNFKMEINPVSTAAYFLEIVKDKFPHQMAKVSDEDKQFAEKLLQSFLDMLTEYTIEETYELEGKWVKLID